MIKLLEWPDLLYSVFLIILFYLFAKSKSSKEIEDKPYYKYYHIALVYRMIFASIFCLLYWKYYGGGDTIGYFLGSKAMHMVMLNDFSDYVFLLLNDPNGWAWAKFEKAGFFPEVYMFRDSRTYLVMKLTSVIGFLGFGGFMATTLFVSRFTFQWIWMIFEVLAKRYPSLVKELSWCFLFLPSVVFWGGGIIKDTYTFAAACGIFVYINRIFIQGDKKLSYFVIVGIFIFVIFSIKSYILLAFLPSLLLYVNFERLKKIKSVFVKIFVLPITLGFSAILLSLFIPDYTNSNEGFSSDKLLTQAAVQQQDLKRDFYGDNSFDIGEFEPNLIGVLKKAPQAINAAFFRPYIWEVGSPTMVFSGIENIIVLGLAFWLLLTKGILTFFRNIFQDSFLLFCLIYCLILGFMVGFSTPNFGALVRYRIPIMPFLLFMFLILKDKTSKKSLDTSN